MKLLVIDGNSILNRAFYGIRMLTTKDGQHTNGIYGFLTMLLKLMDITTPDGVCIAFDVKKPTFRHEMYSGYKAQRKGMPEELAEQMQPLKDLLSALGFKIIEAPGFEADDILGTFAKMCEQSGDDCIIATGDKDSLQLVSDKVNVRIAATKMGRPEATLYDLEKIKEDFALEPKQLIDVKAIQGDTSDNIPGIKGIGQKGALDLIQRYHDLDNIYENVETIDVKPAMRKKLIEGRESAFLSRKLGKINRNVPLDVSVDDCKILQPNEEAARLMAKLEMFSLIDKFGLREVPVQTAEEAPKKKVSVIYDKTEFSDVFLCDIKDSEIVKTAFVNDDKIYVTTEDIAAFLEDKSVKKKTHDLKPLFAYMDKVGKNLENAGFDTSLAAYLLNPSSTEYDIKRLASEYEVETPELEGAREEDVSFLENAVVLPKLIEKLLVKITANEQESLLNDIEIPLCEVLAKMENRGFMVDKQGISQYGEMLGVRLEKLEEEVYKLAGCEFNINSPKQLGEVLFDKLKLPHGKKTKTGYSTSAKVLDKLKFEHPVVEMVLEYRTLAKLKSTYCDGLLKVIASDGRIHTSFNQTETRTGRISSTEPNMQNIPVRTDLGREMRRFFIAKEGYVLVDADYSQIELRVLAHIADDKNMIDAFLQETDIHTITASQVFGMPPEMVTPIMRSRAKAVNFGIVYGIGAFSLSKDIGVTMKEASNYINSYLDHYSGVKEYMSKSVQQAKDTGFARTIFGRRRYLPELTSSNYNLRSFGERVAMNMPIQGTAADIIKISMIRVENRLKEENLKSRLILQVHDELIVEAPEDEAEKVKAILKEEMEAAVSMKVPIIADAASGKTWYDAKM